ncbi:MAG: hypothetical protein J0I92_09380, partial [Phyllobacterium sp.]|nr:hypothetical protein [Phyllobacterium sp.]
ASEDKLLLESEHMAAFHRTYQPMRKQFIDAGGTKDDFNSRVFSYIEDRRINRNDFYPEEVRKAGDAFATVRASELKLQKNARVREGGEARPVQGADLTPENKNYVPHEWDTVKVNLLNEHLEEDAVRLTLKGGLRKANLNADEATLDRISAGMLKTLSGRGAGIDKNDFIARVSGADVEDALKALVEHHGISEEDSKAFFAAFKKQKAAKDDAGNPTPFKTRALIDVDYKLPYRPKVRDTGVEWDRDLTLKDLLNTDIEHLNNKYTNRAAGNIALARMHIINPATGETIVNGVTSNAEWAGLLRDLAKKGANSGQTEAQIAMDAKRLNYAYEMIKGTYQHDMSSNGFGKFLRVVQKFNFIRVMNQVGLAQIPELANNVGSAGLTATMQQMPGFRRIVGRDGVMHLKDGFGDDLEAVFGHGLDHWTRTAEERHDAALDAIKASRGQTFEARYQKLNGILDKGARITNMMSGMHGIDTMSRRWAYKAIVQKFANAAAGRASFSEKRLADMGLSPEMFTRVKVELKNVDNVSMDGKKVTGLNLDNWQDKEASEAFRRAVHRKANEVIQKNDIGNMAMWMGTPLGKTLIQFRSFMAASYVKHTLKGLYMHDPEVMINAAIGMAVAAGVYEVQTRINAVGRSDADKYLKDRLSPDKIALAAFSKVGVSSVVPMLVDTAITPMGYKPLFSYSRTSGQASDLWLGNPTKGFVDDIGMAAGATRGIVAGNPSQQELRSLNKLMPFNNAFGYLQLFNASFSGFSERTPSDRRKQTEIFQ